jgi:hypothetical protein
MESFLYALAIVLMYILLVLCLILLGASIYHIVKLI